MTLITGIVASPWRRSRGRAAAGHSSPTQLAGRRAPVGAPRQDDATGAIAVDCRRVHAGRPLALVTPSGGSAQHAPSRANHHLVRAPQVLLGAVDERAHALRDRLVLLVDAGDPGEAVGAL